MFGELESVTLKRLFRHRFRPGLFGFVLAACTVVCADFANAPGQQAELRVLFIGNSLTYANDLPAIVEALAEASKQRHLVYTMMAYPDLSLEDHWARGDAQKAITTGNWDVVVLQQGPSALEESRQLLLKYTRFFDKPIRAFKARPALYMVWPSEARARDFDRVVESYRLAAADVKGMLFPVGEAWREARKLDANLALYAEDRFHPSVAGSYLAALVIYEKLFERSPIGLPASLKLRSRRLAKIELPEDTARLLQLAASQANKKF
jgi:hypothetical protein